MLTLEDAFYLHDYELMEKLWETTTEVSTRFICLVIKDHQNFWLNRGLVDGKVKNLSDATYLLQHCVYSDNYKAFRMLMKHGVVFSPCIYSTIFYQSFCYDFFFFMLEERKVNPNSYSFCFITYVNRGDVDIVRILLRSGFQEKAKSWSGYLQAASRLKKNRLSMMFELFLANFNCDGLSENDQKVLHKLKAKRQNFNAKKIYFWWIPICYSLDHFSGCGQRMAIKNYKKYLALFDD